MRKLERKTKRLLVRALRPSDYAKWNEALSNRLPAKNKFDEGPLSPETLSRESFRKRLLAFKNLREADMLYAFSLFDRRSGKIVGSIDLLIIQRLKFQCANLGYQIHNNFWGKGFATEGALAVTDIAFRDLGLHRLEALMEPANKASLGVAKRLKMRREGIRRGYFFDGKAWQDAPVYSLLAEDLGFRGVIPTIRAKTRDYFRG